jgi:hypothetical protein
VDTHGADPNKPLIQNLFVAPLLPGTKIELPNIYYNFNDATLRPDARKDLDLVIALMQQQPTVVIELASHTDCRGTSEYNQDLSQRRANGVVEYLVTKGVDRKRLIPVGYGESEPRNRCTDGVNCTEQEHARNRRTEMKINTGVDGGSMVYVDGYSGTPTPQKNSESGNTTANKPAPGKVTVSAADKDSYYVVAGSFLMESRASNRANTLKEAGYTDTQVMQFPGSPYFSVVVAKFKTRKEAQVVENKLETDKFEAFVRAGE